jgi:hypothetical protein
MQWQGGTTGSFWSEDFGVSLLSLSSGRLLCSSRGLMPRQGGAAGSFWSEETWHDKQLTDLIEQRHGQT